MLWMSVKINNSEQSYYRLLSIKKKGSKPIPIVKTKNGSIQKRDNQYVLSRKVYCIS